MFPPPVYATVLDISCELLVLLRLLILLQHCFHLLYLIFFLYFNSSLSSLCITSSKNLLVPIFSSWIPIFPCWMSPPVECLPLFLWFPSYSVFCSYQLKLSPVTLITPCHIFILYSDCNLNLLRFSSDTVPLAVLLMQFLLLSFWYSSSCCPSDTVPLAVLLIQFLLLSFWYSSSCCPFYEVITIFSSLKIFAFD